MIRAIIAIMLSIVSTILAGTNQNNMMTAPDYETDFVPEVRFEVMSDTHIKKINDDHSSRLQKAINFAYDYSSKNPYYDKLDAVVIAGDLTNNGTVSQFVGFSAALKTALHDDTKFLGVVAKNHDGYTFDKLSQSLFKTVTGNDSDYHTVINGYHFIGLSASKIIGKQYDNHQKEWLRAELDKAVADDPSKPIFVTHHEHSLNTVYGSSDFDGWGLEYFRDIINDYPQVIDFSGHSHYPSNDPRSIWQGEFTAVGTGAIAYMELTVDNDRKVHPEDNENGAQSWIVEVDKNNRVRLIGVDVLRGEYLCEYVIDSPADINARQFTPELNEASSSAPVFASGSSITAEKLRFGYKFTAPAAESTDGKIVFLYRINIYDKDGNNIYTDRVVNNYWNADSFKEITFKTDSVPSGSRVEITALNAYYMESAPLVYIVE